MHSWTKWSTVRLHDLGSILFWCGSWSWICLFWCGSWSWICLFWCGSWSWNCLFWCGSWSWICILMRILILNLSILMRILILNLSTENKMNPESRHEHEFEKLSTLGKRWKTSFMYSYYLIFKPVNSMLSIPVFSLVSYPG